MHRMVSLLAVACIGSVACIGLVACGATGGSSATGKDSKFCSLSRSFAGSLQFAAGINYKSRFAHIDSILSQYPAAAPPEIKADVNTLVGAVRQLEDSAKAHNYRVQASDLTFLSGPAVTQASERIGDYGTRVCGLGATTT